MDVDLANALLGLAAVRQHQADLREARELYHRALDLFQRALDPRHPRVAEALALLGLLTAQRGDPREAVSLSVRAEEIGREHLRLTNRSLSEREGLAYAESRTRAWTWPCRWPCSTGRRSVRRSRLSSMRCSIPVPW